MNEAQRSECPNERVVINPDYPDPICQDCGKWGDEFEEVTTGIGCIELWVYCVKCDQETFHPTPDDKGL